MDELEAVAKESADGSEPVIGADPYADKQAISERLSKVLDVDKAARVLLSRDWFRNVLFITGCQWLIWANGRWRQRDLPSWFPRAQTNKFAEKYNDLVTQLVQTEPAITYRPATEDAQDQATAAIAERVKEVAYAEAGIEDKTQEVASWIIATGNCFGIPFYDMDPDHGMSFVAFQTCDACQTDFKPEELADQDPDAPACPQCSGPLRDSTDPTGAPMGDDYPTGALQMDVCAPFEIRLDQRVRDFKKLRRFVRVKKYDVDWAKEHWEQFADKITADSTGDDLDQYYMDLLANVTSSYGAGAGYLGAGQSQKQPKVTAYEFYELPTKKFPEGIRAVRLGKSAEAIVEAGPLPTKYGAGVKKGQKFLNIVKFGFDLVPGRLWNKTRLDDLVPLQIQRNQIDATIRLTCQRMGNPVWLNPKGSGVEIITGEPGQKIDYNPMSVGGTSFAKPERIPAELGNLQPLIFQLQKIDDAMERIAGTFFLQGGNAPPGVTAASALQYLGEKGQQSMSLLTSAWAKGWREVQKQFLEIARQNWDEPRLRVVSGKNKKWQVEQFQKSDLQGSVDLIIDYNGLGPKSVAAERATIAQLVQLGAINPQDKQTQVQILKAMGQMKLLGSADLDEQDAIKEQDRFLTDETYVPAIRPFVDNSEIHLAEHTDFAKTDEFMELPPERQQAWYEHIKNTVLDITTRRIALTQAGLDPNVPALSEVPSADSVIGAQAAAAAMQGGGVPSGAEQPDPRLDATGNPLPTPDISAISATSPGSEVGSMQQGPQ